MKHPHWSEIYIYFREFQQQKSQLENKKLSNEILSTIKNSLTTSMKHLINNLKQTLDEQSVHYISFALTALLDEEVQRILTQSANNLEWPSLQKNLFNLTNAGEVFFDTLDEILEASLPTIIFEIYYFVLKKGFRGKYEYSPNRIAKYLEFLSVKIENPVPTKKEKEKKVLIPLPKIKFKIWQYYTASAMLVVCLYIALAIQTNVV